MKIASGYRYRSGHPDATGGRGRARRPRLFLNLAGLAPPQGIQGAAILPYLCGAASARAGTLIESRITSKVYQQAYINERYKLVVYAGEAWGELYDLQTDPDQYTNLWGRDDALQLRLQREMLEQRMFDEGHRQPRKSFV